VILRLEGHESYRYQDENALVLRVYKAAVRGNTIACLVCGQLMRNTLRDAPGRLLRALVERGRDGIAWFRRGARRGDLTCWLLLVWAWYLNPKTRVKAEAEFRVVKPWYRGSGRGVYAMARGGLPVPIELQGFLAVAGISGAMANYAIVLKNCGWHAAAVRAVSGAIQGMDVVVKEVLNEVGPHGRLPADFEQWAKAKREVSVRGHYFYAACITRRLGPAEEWFQAVLPGAQAGDPIAMGYASEYYARVGDLKRAMPLMEGAAKKGDMQSRAALATMRAVYDPRGALPELWATKNMPNVMPHLVGTLLAVGETSEARRVLKRAWCYSEPQMVDVFYLLTAESWDVIGHRRRRMALYRAFLFATGDAKMLNHQFETVVKAVAEFDVEGAAAIWLARRKGVCVADWCDPLERWGQMPLPPGRPHW
jgi:hypothetical protein